ncbi:hypothetical protein ACUOCP_40795 [Escherichia sp. R-CC3]
MLHAIATIGLIPGKYFAYGLEGTEVGQTLWLTTDVARQFISILEAGIAKIESGDFPVNEYRRN